MNSLMMTGRMLKSITALLVVVLVAGGCATNSLWEPRTHLPTDQPDLSLALDPQSGDVLVQYDEHEADRPEWRRRAYWLFASTNRPPDQRKPVFVNPRNYSGLDPIPLLEQAPSTNAPPPAGYAALPTPAQQGFDLWQDGVFVNRYYLPIYLESPKPTVWRVIATPFAALGDATVVVLVVVVAAGIIVGLLYLESQAG